MTDHTFASLEPDRLEGDIARTGVEKGRLRNGRRGTSPEQVSRRAARRGVDRTR